MRGRAPSSKNAMLLWLAKTHRGLSTNHGNHEGTEGLEISERPYLTIWVSRHPKKNVYLPDFEVSGGSPKTDP